MPMSAPILIACPMCALGQPLAYFLAFWIGGVVISRWLLRLYIAHVSTIWGWPRLRFAHGAALLAILAWPAFACYVGQQNHGLTRVAACTAGLVLCAVYLWLRGTWLLEQCQVVAPSRQILLLGLLGPLSLVAGFMVGYGVLGLVFLGMAWPIQAIPWFLVHAGPGVLLAMILQAGLSHVFSVPTPEEP